MSPCWPPCCCSSCASAPCRAVWPCSLTILAAWLYAGVTGWQAPVLRSAAGMSLYGIGRIFFREGRMLNILAAVALLFVVADPEQLFDASFQLSFLAVALIGAFVVPALDATSAPLASGLRQISTTPANDLRLAPKSAQFRLEMRLLARTLPPLPRRLRAIRGRPDRALLPLPLGNLRHLVLHPDRPGPADDRLLPPAVGLGTHRQRHRRARLERNRAAGLSGHRRRTPRCSLISAPGCLILAKSPSAFMPDGSRTGASPPRRSGWPRSSPRR